MSVTPFHFCTRALMFSPQYVWHNTYLRRGNPAGICLRYDQRILILCPMSGESHYPLLHLSPLKCCHVVMKQSENGSTVSDHPTLPPSPPAQPRDPTLLFWGREKLRLAKRNFTQAGGNPISQRVGKAIIALKECTLYVNTEH